MRRDTGTLESSLSEFLLSKGLETTYAYNDKVIVTCTNDRTRREALVNMITGKSSDIYLSVTPLVNTAGLVRFKAVTEDKKECLLNQDGEMINGISSHFNSITNIPNFPNLYYIALGSMRAIINEHGELESVDCFEITRDGLNGFICNQGLREVRMKAKPRETISGTLMYRLVHEMDKKKGNSTLHQKQFFSRIFNAPTELLH